MMSNVERHRQSHEDFSKGDLAAVAGQFTTDAIYTDHARRLSVKGPEEFASWVGEWRSAMSDAAVTDAEYIDGGDWTVARFVGRGTHDGMLAGIPATGRPLELDFCEILRFDSEGRVAQGEMYYDIAGLMAQITDSPS